MSVNHHSKKNTMVIYTKGDISLSIDYRGNIKIWAIDKDGMFSVVLDNKRFYIQTQNGNTVETFRDISCEYPFPNICILGR